MPRRPAGTRGGCYRTFSGGNTCGSHTRRPGRVVASSVAARWCAVPPCRRISRRLTLDRLRAGDTTEEARGNRSRPLPGADGREEQIAEVRRRIDAEGITYIYYQFVSVTGRIMGKGVPAAHWESMAREGLPARLRRDRQPLHRPARRVHRLRPRGRASWWACRSAETFEVLPWDREGRARLVHLLPRTARSERTPALVPHLRLPRQPQAHPGGVRARRRGSTCAPAPSPR